MTALVAAIVLAVILIGGYFGYYAAVVLPDIRAISDEVILSAGDTRAVACSFVPMPTGSAYAGALYEQAVGLDRGGDRFVIDDLEAFARRSKPARPKAEVNPAAINLVRRAAACRSATLPGDSLTRAMGRAGLGTSPGSTDIVRALSRFGVALVGAGEVHAAANRRQAARSDFDKAYNVGRHLAMGAADVEAYRLSIAVRRMASAGLEELANTDPNPDEPRAKEIDRHLRMLATLSRSIESKWMFVQGSHPEQVGAAARVARDDKDVVWRREAVIGLIRLSRLRPTSAPHAWLIRRRARAELARLAHDPDEIVAGLASAALK